MSSSRWLALIPVLILLWIVHFFVDTMLGIWPVYKSMAQLDLVTAGLIVAVGAFIGEGSQLIFGSFSDKGYRKLLIMVGLLATTASAFLSYSNSYVVLFCLYLLTCLGSGCFHPAAAGLVSSLVPNRRGLLMTLFASGGSLGLASGQLIFTQTYTFFEGHTFLLALPAVALAIVLLFYRFPQIQQVPGISYKVKLSDCLGFFKKPALRTLYFSQVANQSIMWGTIFILPDALKTLGHVEWICYGGGHLFFILGGACMMVPGGYLADAYSARKVMLYAGIISCAAFYFVLFSGGISETIVLIALFVLGAFIALINPIGISLGTRLEPNHPGAISAFLMGLVWCVSEALGPGGVGLMSGWFSDYAAVKALAVLGSLFLVQIYATICLPKEEPVWEAEIAS
jgi:FSR family fosmidomycin resistance protein-like MFS transporter